MTTYPFIPSATTPFEFQPILDGVTYTAIVTWGLFGRRYYISVYAIDGTRVFTMPVIGSPENNDISMTKGYFTSKLIYRVHTQQFEVSP